VSSLIQGWASYVISTKEGKTMAKYRVLIDLGWHEANSKSEAIEQATSKKWQLHQLGYHAITPQEVIKPPHDYWDKEEQINHAWSTRNDDQYWEH
jgi:predicted nuclease of restriction endonuclease-like (RecB) superfamily